MFVVLCCSLDEVMLDEKELWGWGKLVLVTGNEETSKIENQRDCSNPTNEIVRNQFISRYGSISGCS